MIKFIETYPFLSFFFLSRVLARQFPDLSREQLPLTLFGASATDYHRWDWSALWDCGIIYLFEQDSYTSVSGGSR